jgi:hypothetical protein
MEAVMATNVILKRWIVVSPKDLGWVPHPSTALYLLETEAQARIGQIIADGQAGTADLFVKFVELSEIV